MRISEISLYKALRNKLNDETSSQLADLDYKTSLFLTKEDKIDLIEKMNKDKIDLIKWMFGFWITLVLMLLANWFLK